MHPGVCSKARHIAFEVSQIRSSDPAPWLLLDLLCLKIFTRSGCEVAPCSVMECRATSMCISPGMASKKKSVKRLAPMNLHIGRRPVSLRLMTALQMLHSSFFRAVFSCCCPAARDMPSVRIPILTLVGICWGTFRRFLPGLAHTADKCQNQ